MSESPNMPMMEELEAALTSMPVMFFAKLSISLATSSVVRSRSVRLHRPTVKLAPPPKESAEMLDVFIETYRTSGSCRM